MIQPGDWAAYKYVDFGSGVNHFTAQAGSLFEGGQIEIHLDQPDGPLVGTCVVPRTGSWQLWQTVSCPIQKTLGVHVVYLVFRGKVGRLFDLLSFSFAW